jgi:hypothetical protein
MMSDANDPIHDRTRAAVFITDRGHPIQAGYLAQLGTNGPKTVYPPQHGRRVLYRESDLLAWIAEQRAKRKTAA